MLKNGKEIYEQRLSQDISLENGNWMTGVKLWKKGREINVS